MGCKTCKQKNQKKVVEEKENDPDVLNINLIPKEIQEGNFNGNFLFKLIAFLVLTIAIPLIVLVLLGQIFLSFFFPKSLPKVTKKFKDFFVKILNSYGKFRHDREVRKRKKQFEKTEKYKSYTDEDFGEFYDIETYSDNKDNKVKK